MDLNRIDTACFTGHRIIPEADEQTLRIATENAIRDLLMRGYSTFITGGALGFDTMAHRIVLKLREEFPFVRSVMAIPCKNQDAHWREQDRILYRHLLEMSDERIVLNPVYTPSCMHERNRFMVDHSSACIAYYDGRHSGGTASTYRYAQRTLQTLINVFPHSAQIQLR